jgi:hypothetical protein
MRIRISAPNAWHVEQLAKAEGRSIADAADRLIYAGVCARRGASPTVEAVERGDDGDEYRSISLHVTASINSAIRKLAAESGRSISWIGKDLLRSALKARGALPVQAEAEADA